MPLPGMTTSPAFAQLGRSLRLGVRLRLQPLLMQAACVALSASAGLAQAQAQAQTQTQGASTPEAPLDARAWLMRTHEAASSRNYQGTLVFSNSASMSASRVAHFCEGSQQYERVEAMDGEPRSLLRHNDTVHTVWPRAKVAVVEQRDARATFPALLSAGERRVLELYELRVLGVDRVAGRDADVVLLKAKDSLRFSQRLWADRQTGLLLRSDTVGANGQTLESAAFTELSINVKPQPELVTGPLRKLDGYKVLRPQMAPSSLAAEGWQMGAVPAGFREMQCAKRSLDPAGQAGAPVVLQVIYSDGLTHVSLFIEPFSPQRHQVEGTSVVGATHTFSVRRDDVWLTALGDVPPETLKRFVAALEQRKR